MRNKCVGPGRPICVKADPFALFSLPPLLITILQAGRRQQAPALSHLRTRRYGAVDREHGERAV